MPSPGPPRARERGNQRSMGRTHHGGSAGSFSASPTANPAGRQRRSVCLRTSEGSRRGWRQPARLWPCSRSPRPGLGGVRELRRNQPGGSSACAPAGKARLVRGKAIAPANAPARVKAVIAAANRIRNKPYIWGGGHGRWEDNGYDCSGSVSYALHGGNFLSSPLPSGPLESWGHRGARALDQRLRQLRPRLRGDRRAALGHLDDGRRRPRLEQADALLSGYVVRHPSGY